MQRLTSQEETDRALAAEELRIAKLRFDRVLLAYSNVNPLMRNVDRSLDMASIQLAAAQQVFDNINDHYNRVHAAEAAEESQTPSTPPPKYRSPRPSQANTQEDLDPYISSEDEIEFICMIDAFEAQARAGTLPRQDGNALSPVAPPTVGLVGPTTPSRAHSTAPATPRLGATAPAAATPPPSQPRAPATPTPAAATPPPSQPRAPATPTPSRAGTATPAPATPPPSQPRVPTTPASKKPYNGGLLQSPFPGNKHYIVIRGRRIGIYTSWARAAPLVAGLGNKAIYQGYANFEEAKADYFFARDKGFVQVIRNPDDSDEDFGPADCAEDIPGDEEVRDL